MNKLHLEMSVKPDEELAEIINNSSDYSEEIIQAATLERAERMVRDGEIELSPQIRLSENSRLASFWLRLIAYFIDIIIISISSILLIRLIQKIQPSLIYNLSDSTFLIILNVIVIPLYFSILESSKYRGTIGKLILKLSVVNSTFNRISFGKALLRNLSKILSSMILLLGYVSILSDTNKQGWHDMIAGCYVLKNR